MQFILITFDTPHQNKIRLATSHLFNDLGFFFKEVQENPSSTHPCQIKCFFSKSGAGRGIYFSGCFCSQLKQIEVGYQNQNQKHTPIEFDFEFDDDKLIVKGNLLAWIYFIISLGEDCLINKKQRDKHGRIPYLNSTAYFQDWLKEPKISQSISKFSKAVEEYCRRLNSILFIKKPWPGHYNKAVILSHDIDVIDKWLLYAAKLSMENIFKKNFPAFFKIVTSSIKNYCKGKNPTRDLKWILDLEKKYNFVSSWHFLSGKVTLKSIFQADITYNLSAIKSLIPLIFEYRGEIALHSSYFTPEYPDTLINQSRDLANSVGEDIYGVRAHFLRSNGPLYMKSAVKAGVMWESNNGFAETSGFKTGFAGAFQPVADNKKSGLWEFPLHWMDRSYSKYGNITPEEIFQEFSALASQFDKYGGVFTLLWHNYSVTDLGFLKYESLYNHMLSYLKTNNFYNDTPANLVRWFNKKESVELELEGSNFIIKGVDNQISSHGIGNSSIPVKIYIDCDKMVIESHSMNPI